MNRNGLSINIITAQKLILLYLKDSIEYKEWQRSTVEKVLTANKEKKLKPKVEALVNATYTMAEFYNRTRGSHPRCPTSTIRGSQALALHFCC